MKRSLKQRIEMGRKMGLPEAAARKLARLKSPADVQDFVSSLKMNHEPGGDTCRSAAEVLKRGEAHCIEAAFVAAAALWMMGYKPLLMDMQAKGDHDHVICIFQERGHWGAISKSNHVWLRWRDAIYKTPRELALSYFHEYTKGRRKTLRNYSVPFDLRRYKNNEWVNSKEDCWDIAGALDEGRHYSLVTTAQAKKLRLRDMVEMKADKLTQYKKKRKKTA
jgi:hypothetical protein